jgi:hypothetical protein
MCGCAWRSQKRCGFLKGVRDGAIGRGLGGHWSLGSGHCGRSVRETWLRGCVMQGKRAVRSVQEYPGSTVWVDYEVLCPECGQWSETYGQVDRLEANGEWHCLCLACGDRLRDELRAELRRRLCVAMERLVLADRYGAAVRLGRRWVAWCERVGVV